MEITSVGRFVEVCGRRGLKVKTGKNKVVLLDGEERLKCEVCVHGMRLGHDIEGRRGGLGLGLYSWTTSEVCWVSGEWTKSQMQG